MEMEAEPEAGYDDYQQDENGMGHCETPAQEEAVLMEDIPCLACGSNCLIKTESVEEPEPTPGSTLTENELLLSFCQFLKVRRTGELISFQGPGSNSEQQVPLCGACRNQLVFLQKSQDKIKELERDLQNAVNDFRKGCMKAETTFVEKGVYEKDGRYLRIRKQIFNPRGRPVVPATKKNDIQDTSRRKSERKRGRGRPKKNNYVEDEIDEMDPFLQVETKVDTTTLPIIVISAQDMSIAEAYFPDNQAGHENIQFEIDAEKDVIHPKPKRKKKGSGQQKLKKAKDSTVAAVASSSSEQTIQNSDSVERTSRTRRKKLNYTIDDDDMDFPFEDDADPLRADWDNEEDHPDTEIKISRERDSTNEEKKGRTSGKKKQKGKKKRLEDEDFIPPEYLEDNDDEEEDNSAEDSDGDFDLDETGKRKRTHLRPQVDPVSGIITYGDTSFEPIENGKVNCLKCQRTVTNKTETMSRHHNRYHTDRFVCSKCGFRFESRSMLKKHVDKIHKGIKVPPKRHLCEICGKPHLIRTKLNVHRWTHYSEEDKLEAFARGEKMPTKPKPWKVLKYQCEDCGKSFSDKKYMSIHKLAVHGTDEEKSKAKELCSICGRSEYSFYMSNHMRYHHPELAVENYSKFSCTLCDKTFRIKKFLLKHKRSVHEEKPFKCELCGKGFANQRSFTGHMNLHNNIRPWKCDHCDLWFASEIIRRKHSKLYHVEGSKAKRAPFLRGLAKSDRAAAAEAGSKIDVDSVLKGT